MNQHALLPAEFHAVTPESIEAAKAAQEAERAEVARLTGLTFKGDEIRTPAEIIYMPKIARGSVDVRVRLSVVLENLERQYGWELLAERFALLAETKK